MEPLGIALIGCGTVGGGVAQLLLNSPTAWPPAPAGRLVLRRIVVRDLEGSAPCRSASCSRPICARS